MEVKYKMEHYNELYHTGVIGMKWGKRKAGSTSSSNLARDKAMQEYGDAKKKYKQTLQSVRKGNRFNLGVGIDNIQKLNKAQSKIDTASMNVISAKAKYNAAKQKTSGKAAKAEFNTYRKAMQKTGIRGSAADVGSGSRSTTIYNHIKEQKGKAYADKIEKKVLNRAYTAIVTTTAVAAGSMAVSAYLESR